VKKSIIIGLHIGFWLCYLVLTIVLVGLSLQGEGNNTIVDETTERVLYFTVIPSVISYYLFYFLVFPKIREKKFVLSFIYALSFAIGASLLGNLLIYIFLGIESLTERGQSMIVGIIFSSCVCLATGVVALIINGFISWYEELKLKEELKQKNHEMEMALVLVPAVSGKRGGVRVIYFNSQSNKTWLLTLCAKNEREIIPAHELKIIKEAITNA